MLKDLHSILHINEQPASTATATPVPLRKLMMRDLAWLVLFSYVLLIFSPIMPVLADKVAHTFFEKKHMLTVHMVNGKYHVHYDLINAAKQAEKDKSGRNSKTDTNEYFPALSYTTLLIFKSRVIKKPYACTTCSYPIRNVDIDYPPPRV